MKMMMMIILQLKEKLDIELILERRKYYHQDLANIKNSFLLRFCIFFQVLLVYGTIFNHHNDQLIPDFDD